MTGVDKIGIATIERPLAPFGLEVRVPEGTRWEDLPVEQVHRWVATHRVLILRGLVAPTKMELPAAARRLGPLQPWSFGAVNELRPESEARNYLYTRGAVPLHWDGAFAGRVPRYLFFHCLEAPAEAAGGETVFVDTTRVWRAADPATRDRWESLCFTYRTERVVHYGGRFSAPVVAHHPYSGEPILRFAEPVDDLNPVSVRAEELGPLESAAMITELRSALEQPDAVLLHAWQSGDLVIADNHALLHGRRAFGEEAPRHIRRINVHGPERGFLDDIRDSVRIRRPEFMVAEIPILLIPALLATRPGELTTGRFALLTALFFLLFHFGDMVNCLADRDLDAVYKTHLSEAIYGLGVRHVQLQIGITVVLALALSVLLVQTVGSPAPVALVVAGLLLGSQYSLGPLWLKGRGLWQVLALWAVIFVGPMLLVARSLTSEPALPLLGLIAAYGAMQQGIVLVNTAEDLPEDEAAGVRTAALALGLRGGLGLALAMVAVGGAAVAGLLATLLVARGRPFLLPLLPLAVAWTWVVLELTALLRRTRGLTVTEAVVALRPRARRVPLWITATAWSTLLGAWLARGVGASP